MAKGKGSNKGGGSYRQGGGKTGGPNMDMPAKHPVSGTMMPKGTGAGQGHMMPMKKRS